MAFRFCFASISTWLDMSSKSLHQAMPQPLHVTMCGWGADGADGVRMGCGWGADGVRMWKPVPPSSEMMSLFGRRVTGARGLPGIRAGGTWHGAMAGVRR